MPQGKPTLDTKTEIVYPTRNAAGRAVAPELGLKIIPNYSFIWYDVVRLAEPNRFVDVETGEPIQKDGSLGFTKVDACSFGYPKHCSSCRDLLSIKANPTVQPYYHSGSKKRVMLIGQDPTIYRNQDKIKFVLDLDKENGQLRRWLSGMFGKDTFNRLTVYATNVVKCSFDKPPSLAKGGGFRFLKPYFEKCKGYLTEEIISFSPNLVLTFGEPAHKLFVTVLDNQSDFGASMQKAFIGEFKKAKLRGFEFDYSPCPHIKTFRVAETYGENVYKFKDSLHSYMLRGDMDER